jgi:hypothetical protein
VASGHQGPCHRLVIGDDLGTYRQSVGGSKWISGRPLHLTCLHLLPSEMQAEGNSSIGQCGARYRGHTSGSREEFA